MITILDCYTDEPAGLGVPPYLGVYPRYISGLLGSTPTYLTIDDLRLYRLYGSQKPITQKKHKTDIRVHNLTRNYQQVERILSQTKELVIIVGVHTPGKYLSAIPGTLNELRRLLEGVRARKVLTGPVAYGTQLHGGKRAERVDMSLFDEVRKYDYDYQTISKAAIKGAGIIEQIPDTRVIEIETSKGCTRKTGCSFCLEPIKNRFEHRKREDILKEIKEFHRRGSRHFRLGKQSCIYAYPELKGLLKDIRAIGEIQTLHVDNANPASIVSDKGYEKTKALVKYCTPGNVAALGIESFDPEVVRQNNLNSDPEVSFKAIRILNELGGDRGENGMPKLLPGINLLLGLKGESRLTFRQNLEKLSELLEKGMLIRRINIRKVIPFPGTPLEQDTGNKYLRKNSRHYYRFRRDVRENVDNPMLRLLVPNGAVLKDVIPEIYDGNTTFGRQMGTYPLIIGIKGRLPLGEKLDVRVTGHMLRSIVAEPISHSK